MVDSADPAGPWSRSTTARSDGRPAALRSIALRVLCWSGGLVLLACGDLPELPGPGASQGGRIVIYEEEGSDPAVLTFQRVEVPDGDRERLIMHQAGLELVGERGRLYLWTPAARRRSGAGGWVDLEEPIRLVGVRADGVEVLGRAAAGELELATRSLILHDLELVGDGVVSRLRRMVVANDGSWSWEGQRNRPFRDPWYLLRLLR